MPIENLPAGSSRDPGYALAMRDVSNRIHFFEGPRFSDTCFFFALALSHLALAAFRASSFRSSGVSAFIRAFPPLGPPFLPPRFPISRMMRETTSSFTSIAYRDTPTSIDLFSCMPEAALV